MVFQKLFNYLNNPGLLASLLRGAGTIFGIQIIGSGVGYLSQIFLARWLGAGQYGVYTYILALTAIVSTLPLLGLRTAAMRFIPEYETKRDLGRVKGTIQSSVGLALGTSILISAIGTAIVFTWINIGKLANSSTIMLGIWFLPILTIFQLNISFLKASRQHFYAFFPMKVLRPALIILGTCSLFFWHSRSQLNSFQALAVALITVSILVILQVFFLRKSLWKRCRSAVATFEIRQLLRVSLPLLLLASFQTFVKQTDIIMIGAFLSTKDVGLYNAALRTASLAGFALTAVSSAVAPMLVSAYTEANLKKLQKLMTRANQLMIVPASIITVGLIIFSSYFLKNFGPEFLAARPVLITLAIAQLIGATTGPVGLLLSLTGFHDESARVRGGVAILNIFLNLVGIYCFGILGAALATTFSLLVEKIWNDWLVVKHIKIKPSILSSILREGSK